MTMRQPEKSAAISQQLIDWVASGDLAPRVPERFPLQAGRRGDAGADGPPKLSASSSSPRSRFARKRRLAGAHVADEPAIRPVASECPEDVIPAWGSGRGCRATTRRAGSVRRRPIRGRRGHHPHSAQTVERGDPERCGEVAVARTADGDTDHTGVGRPC
ncbi:MAG: hypothetical protein R2697_02795 [Ilumatobacteraceae bacterium]